MRDLKGKSEKCFRAYVSLFMRHLCEPGNENAETFADGVPREGLSRQHVLTRIGIMSLIRKKVHEFESINGKHSMPHLAAKMASAAAAAAAAKKPDESEATTATNTPQSGTPASSARASPAPKDEEKKPEASASKDAKDSKDEVVKDEPKKEEVDKKPEDEKEAKETKEEAKEEKMDVDESKPKETADKDAEKDAKAPEEKDKDKEAVEEKEVKEVEEEKKTNGVEEKKDDDSSKKNGEVKEESKEKEEDRKPQKFMFNIADGGFTELHTLWQNEEKAAVPGREFEIWHRRHDYWLLAGKILFHLLLDVLENDCRHCLFRHCHPWIWPLARHPKRPPICHHQRTFQDGRGQRQLFGNQKQVFGPTIQTLGAGSGHRGAIATCSVPELDAGCQPSCHGIEHSVH